MGYVRVRGNYVSVVPPLFAARLVEELAVTQDGTLRTLFDGLNKTSRGRFLERMVTVDLPEKSGFWDYIFADNGPLESAAPTNGHFDHIECLARAVPTRTARFLEAKLKEQPGTTWKGHYCLSTFRELAYQQESCASGMRCLELLALKEIEQTKQLNDAKLFCECFVDWFHDFPMSYQERLAWIERLLKSENRTHRLLGVHVVAFVTESPQTLSGYSVTARRLGQPPPRRLWREIFDYVVKLVQMRFELTQSADPEIAEIARKEFEGSTTQLMGHVSPDQLVTIIEQFVDWHFDGKLISDVRSLRHSIHWAEERYTENSQKPGQEEVHDKWAAVLRRLAALRERFDGGDFLLRLKIATGSAFEYDWEPGEEGRVYGYQKRLRALASEATSNPSLMTDEAWNVLKDANAHQVGEFIQFLGESDRQKQFIGRFESEIGDHAGNWRFGLYCLGLSRSEPAYVESYLDAALDKPTFDKGAMLWALRFIGPTLTNRQRLFRLIKGNSVDPIAVASMFTTGRWLDDLPVSEVVAIMEFIARGEKWPEWALSAMSLYLHPDKPLPRELIPFGERLLDEAQPTYDNGHRFNEVALGIAKTDLERGFALLDKKITALNKTDWQEWRAEWNPLRRHGAHEFWDYLRSQDAERAYRSFCTLKNRHVLRNEILDDDNRASLLDITNHRSVLLKIATENEDDAEQIAASISMKQPGFFSFAFEFLNGRAVDGKVASSLASTVVGRVGFGSELDKLRTAMSEIELQLKRPDTPTHGRAWLERLKHNIQEAITASPWNAMEHEYLGW
jgi:hypothetical protein